MPTVAKKKEEDKTDELFNVNGLSIKKDGVYKIENRLDMKAPSGFQRERSTKLPSADTGNTIQCPYTENVWDTGLFEYSPCYKGEASTVAVTERIKVLTKYIVAPYEKLKGKKGILSQDSDFWDNFSVDLWAGRYLNTNNPEDMLQLYIAMQAGELCPENDQGNPKYLHADFVIVDKAKERSVKQKKAITNIDSIVNFGMLLKENPQKLVAILKYVGVANMTDKIGGDTMKTVFYTWLEADTMNSEKFGNLIEECENPHFEEVVYLHSTLKSLSEKGKLSKNSIGDYVYNGIPLGKDLKSVAKNLVTNSEISDIKAQILEE